ncbi:MerR family transcriptional regulator [Lysinibacillus sp. CD3-6]|uniref:MerR family transcriptional regulator n=1 Tax=Lysinibacillus sp. CD3-6 TaxID=2892541 RepID=UPI00116DBB9A|nr:MerR family transcriptional regulator [Lysinibacillus sp. CD3-6]UED79230.1 MerR family transcriptional regulator [Lysinibacillus sp. CD3-6]
MLTISQVSERTGLTPYTLRYYEKIGVLKGPNRSEGGARAYTESEVSYILCLNNLKKIGLSLEEITEFTRDGCVMEKIQLGADPTKFTPTLNKRTEILSKYLLDLEAKQQELSHMITLTKEKLAGYHELSKGSYEAPIQV